MKKKNDFMMWVFKKIVKKYVSRGEFSEIAKIINSVKK
jgi:hypothetical protein